MKDGDAVGAMPMTIAAEGASGGALGNASRGDLARGFTPLSEAEDPDPYLDVIAGEQPSKTENGMHDGPKNEIWTEHETGGFLKRPHGLER